VETVVGLLIVAGVIAFLFWRSMRSRKELSEHVEEAPKKLSKRERKLEEIRSAEPERVIPTIDDLVAQELDETGVNEITNHEGLADPVKLKVYHRDIGSHSDCDRETLSFLAYGIEAADATIEGVKLVCDGEHDSTGDEELAAEIKPDNDEQDDEPVDESDSDTTDDKSVEATAPDDTAAERETS
jgi:hypothetical protein